MALDVAGAVAIGVLHASEAAAAFAVAHQVAVAAREVTVPPA
jgi:hypothetical protein